MHDCKPMDTPVERKLSLNLDMCLKSVEEKEKNVQSTLLKCYPKSDVCNDVHTSKHML